ncbi:MAG: phosphatase PAP2 family protein [Alphaproteobacteria bacterium]
MSGPAASLLAPVPPRTAALAAAVVVLALMAWVDLPLSNALRTAPAWFRTLGDVLTEIGNSRWWLGPLALLAAAAVVLRWRAAGASARRMHGWLAGAFAFVFAAIAVPGLVNNGLKILIGRARPSVLVEQGIYGFDPFNMYARFHSFPSGHSVTMGALAIALALLLPAYRLWFFAAGVLLAATRMVVNAHFASDVAAGLAVGAAGAILVARLFAARGWVFTRGRDGALRLAAPGRLWRRRIG